MVTALSHLDYQLLVWVTSLTETQLWLRPLVEVAAKYLVGVFPVVLLVLWYRPEWRGREHGAQKAVMLAIVSIVLSLALKTVIGFLWFRARPFVSHPELFHLDLQVDPLSFPSAHSLLAFTIAASLWYSGFRRLGGWLLVAAALVAAGRVFAGVHYPSDAVVGSLLGIAVAWWLHREASTFKRYLPNH